MLPLYILTGLTLALSGCARVKIVDHVFCGDEGTIGASCFHTLTDEIQILSKSQWDDMRFGQICTLDPEGHKGETFADWKAVIEKLCSVSSDCDYQRVNSFFQRVERVQAASTR